MATFEIRSVSQNGFRRCNRLFNPEPQIVEEDEFNSEQWERILKESNLHVREVGADSVKDKSGDSDLSDDEILEIVEAIDQLEDGDFDASKKPKVAALKKLLNKDLADKFTAAHRDSIWAEIIPKEPE